jgi:hypothetical protein
MTNQTEIAGYQGVLSIVQQWPTAQQIALVQDVLETLASRIEPARPQRQTLSRALGLLATDGAAPTDEEVEQWLGEHRMEKCGFATTAIQIVSPAEMVSQLNQAQE